MATAMSLADFTAMARIASSTETLSPTRTPSRVGATDSAWAETGTRSLRVSLPACRASKVRYSVISLVIDAG